MRQLLGVEIAIAGLAFLAIVVAHGGAHWLAARALGQPAGVGTLMPGLGCAACARGALRPARALVHLAGPVASYVAIAIAASTLFAVVPMATGASRLVVDDIVTGGAADGVLATGDVIVAVDGQPVSRTGPSVAAVVEASRGATVELQIVRAGAARRVEVTPQLESQSGKRRLGIQLDVEWDHTRLALGPAIAHGFAFPLVRTAQLFGSFVQLFGPSVGDDAGGPVKITRVFEAVSVSPIVRAFRPIFDACILLALALGLYDIAHAIALGWRLRRGGNAGTG